MSSNVYYLPNLASKFSLSTDLLMEEFNFEQVLYVMQLLNWCWWIDGELKVPSLSHIKAKALSLIEVSATKSIKSGQYEEVSAGGFTCRVCPESGSVLLQFTLAESNISADEALSELHSESRV